MLSKKLTFSLTFLVMLLAIGVVFAPSVLADKDNNKTYWDVSVTISEAESMIDVSDKDGIQIESGRTRADRRLDLDGDNTYSILGTLDAGDVIQLSVRFGKPVNLQLPGGSLEDVEEATKDQDEETAAKPAVRDSGGNFGADDMFAAAFDVDGRQLGVLPLKDVAGIEAEFTDAAAPGQDFLVTINQGHLLNAYRTISTGTTVTGSGFEVSRLVFFIPKAQSGVKDKALADDDVDAKVTRGIRKADLTHAIAHFGPDAHQHLNEASNRFEIELVDEDEGDPEYAKIASSSTATDVYDDTSAATIAATTGIPGVVSIMRTASRTGFIETGEFEVRIILTEEPGNIKSILADPTVLVDVENGKATQIVKGVTYKGGHPEIAAQASWHALIPKRVSALGVELIDYYGTGDDGANEPAKIGAADSSPNDGTDDGFPQATGRDNKYYSFIATIQPNPSLSDDTVMVSIKEFPDFKKPIANRYIPLTKGQMSATQLSSAALNVRDARLKNETLSVRVSTAKDTTSKKGAATVAYEARQKGTAVAGNFDSNPNLKALDTGLVIPAKGYLVLARGKKDATDILNSDPKIAKKLTAAQKLYNVKWEFSLPEPAANLQNYFRNGGTLQLVYADIPEATGSGHDDAKASKDGDTTHADYTGYVGASSDPIAAGDVIINEIMWGGSMSNQYIELRNTTDAAIGIDSKEWAIMVGGGTPPAPFTAIDTVGNNPSTGYWKVPGTEPTRILNDLGVYLRTEPAASMSRVPDSADGTAAASWASSVLRMTKADGTSVGIANLRGTYIGTPGAENAYDTSAQDAAKAKATADAKAAADKAKAADVPAAKAGDLKITELMVPSNEGRLPQWIEITNVSAGAVSLKGWVVGIDNDSTDADVVDSSLIIKLDSVTMLAAGQSALVVSKTGRNSGVAARSKGDDNVGALDSNRIVNAHSQIKPASKMYSLLSEKSFRISLQPPLPLAGGANPRSDVVGNLGAGWELPMSEGDRSSIIRREMGATAEITGNDAAGWVLASDTSLVYAYVATYYGDKDDVGTPGYDAGGALPVELSKFGAKRDPLTGQVVVTWETQSELNNAGFFIKRAEHKTAKFVPVNPTLIPGAGTTSEKQSYTYTDTTAKPNIVYYYQIEDVSLDGNRQTLTRAHRLKGHVGAAGKLTTMWGELKEQQ